ncbi:MAG TPA: hypothetical protein VGE09_17695, partial [Pseudoxanthomonas sp.]
LVAVARGQAETQRHGHNCEFDRHNSLRVDAYRRAEDMTAMSMAREDGGSGRGGGLHARVWPILDVFPPGARGVGFFVESP